MRVFTTILFCCFFIMLSAKPIVQGNVSFDLPGTHSFSAYGAELDYDSNFGVGVGVEVLSSTGNSLIGGGVELQLPRGIDWDEEEYDEYDLDPTFNFMPIYLVGKYGFAPGASMNPYLVGHIGFDMFFANDDYAGTADTSGGLYWAVGAEVATASKLCISALFRGCNGSVDILDVSQTNLTLRLGYRFK